MMFCQFGRAHSLREIEQGLKSCEGKLSHLGIKRCPDRACRMRTHIDLGNCMSGRFTCCLALSSTTGARRWQEEEEVSLQNKLVSLDSSVIDLCLQMYDWAKFRTTKGRSIASAARSRRLSAELLCRDDRQGGGRDGGAEA